MLEQFPRKSWIMVPFKAQQYLKGSIIIYGITQVKASAVGEKIEAGMRLAAANTAGHSRALKTVEVQGVQLAESAPVVGIALEALPKGEEGLIWVLVNPQ